MKITNFAEEIESLESLVVSIDLLNKNIYPYFFRMDRLTKKEALNFKLEIFELKKRIVEHYTKSKNVHIILMYEYLIEILNESNTLADEILKRETQD